jgi:hypothetical protein
MDDGRRRQKSAGHRVWISVFHPRKDKGWGRKKKG